MQDPRARPLSIYSAITGVLFNGAVSCVLPLFASSTREAAQMLVALGFGNITASIVYGRIADWIGRFACMWLSSLFEAIGLSLLSVIHLFEDVPGSLECMFVAV